MKATRLTHREAMIEAARRGREAAGTPERYYWAAVWLRLHAKESLNQAEIMGEARSQRALFRDMIARPRHYSARPKGLSDWQWSGLASSMAADSTR